MTQIKSKIAKTITIATIAILLFFASTRSSTKTEMKSYTLSQTELQSLEVGDILLRKGFGMVSAILESSSGSNGVSHCGILTGEYPDYNIIHAISSEFSELDGVQECSLDTFLEEAKLNSLVVVRYVNAKGSAIDSVANIYLGKKAKFDMKFDIRDEGEIFCSELIYLVIRDVSGDHIFDTLHMDYQFNVFFDTTRFKQVIDHRNLRD